MSFKLGWQASCMFAVYIFALSFVVRFIFGAHTLVQAGTEAAVFAVFSAAAYALSYYSSKRSYADGGIILCVFAAGAAMFALGTLTNILLPASFTSSFFLLGYTAVAMLMSWLGYEDEAVEASDRYLQEHGMAELRTSLPRE